jgi:hypothetical protein
MRWLFALAVLAACTDSESRLDDVDAPVGDDAKWQAIAELANPSPPDDLAMLTDLRLTRAEQIAMLETWAEHGGRIAQRARRSDRPFTGEDMACVTAGRIVDDRADDDRALEAALYTAQRLRRAPATMMSALCSAGITVRATRHRAHAPRFAARYAPTDTEVMQAIAAEALYVRRVVAETHDPDPPDWTWLATAPRDRAGFLVELFQHFPPVVGALRPDRAGRNRDRLRGRRRLSALARTLSPAL